jgi:hypothetical protein
MFLHFHAVAELLSVGAVAWLAVSSEVNPELNSIPCTSITPRRI